MSDAAPSPLQRALAADALRLGVAQVTLDEAQTALARGAIEALDAGDTTLLASAYNALIAAYPEPHGHKGVASARLMLAAMLATSTSAEDVRQAPNAVANAVADEAMRQSHSPREAIEAFDWAQHELARRAGAITANAQP